MAYVSTEKKAKIAAALKAVVPKEWRYTLAVRHHSTIVLTVRKGPAALLEQRPVPAGQGFDPPAHEAYRTLNPYHLPRAFPEGSPIVPVAEAILSALNTDNHNRSDSQSDYFDVGHYVEFRIGAYNRPMEVLEA